MVLHAEIICNENATKIVIFNSDTYEQTSKILNEVGPNDQNGVDEIFKSIKFLINNFDQLGCLCICMGSNYENEIRKKFIEAGKLFGFTKISIIDQFTADFIALLSASDAVFKVKLQEGDIVWVFRGPFCRVWRKDVDKIRFFMELKYEDTVESLETIIDAVGANPDIILYEKNYNIKHYILEEVFRQNVRVFSFANTENGVLIKARIMAGDKEVMCYNTEAMLDRDIFLKIGGNTVHSVNKFTSLPYYNEIPVENVNGRNVLQIITESTTVEKAIPNSKNFIIKLNIDVNGIYEIEFDKHLNQHHYQEPYEPEVEYSFTQQNSNPNSFSIIPNEVSIQNVLKNECVNFVPDEPPFNSNVENNTSILLESDLDETDLLNDSPILAALARLQPLPKN